MQSACRPSRLACVPLWQAERAVKALNGAILGGHAIRVRKDRGDKEEELPAREDVAPQGTAAKSRSKRAPQVHADAAKKLQVRLQIFRAAHVQGVAARVTRLLACRLCACLVCTCARKVQS